MIDADRLRAALDRTRSRIADAAAVSGRRGEDVDLVLAGKYIAPEEVPALVAAGAPIIGENRLQDLQAKRAAGGEALTFDFIGHLQRRKVRDVLGEVRLIHTLDSERLAEEIVKRAEGQIRVLVEVNIAGESSKGGIVAAEIPAFIEKVSSLDDLVIGGLMVMPPATAEPDASRPYFDAARRLREELAARWDGRHDLRELSMGTSQDYAVAVEEGATIVRVGRGLIDAAQAEAG